MTSNWKVLNTKFVKLIKIYNCCFGQLSIWESLDSSNLWFLNFNAYKLVFGPQQYWVQRRTIRPCCRCESDVLCERHVYKIKERKKRRHQLNDQWAKAPHNSFWENKYSGNWRQVRHVRRLRKKCPNSTLHSEKDPSIMLNDEDTPWLRQDHNQGSYVKKKFTVVPAWYNDACLIYYVLVNGYYVICYDFTILI